MELYKRTFRKVLILFTLMFCLIWVASSENNVVQAETCDECLANRAACRVACGSGNTACLNACNIEFNICINHCDDGGSGGSGPACFTAADCTPYGYSSCNIPNGQTQGTCQ
jgi:hypothetical protein